MPKEQSFNGTLVGDQTFIPDHVSSQIAVQDRDSTNMIRVRINDDPTGFILDPGDKYGVRKTINIYQVILVPVGGNADYQLTFY